MAITLDTFQDTLGKFTFTQLLSRTGGVLVLTSLSWAIYILCFHPLAHVPGPRLWILSPLPYISVLRRGRFAIRIKELHEIYGPVLRLGVNEVSFIDEQAWTDIYSYHQSSSFPKSPYWYRIRPNGAYGIMASPNAEHGRFRRTYAPAFTEKAVRGQETLVLRHTETLVRQLNREASKGRPVNVVAWFEYVAFDIVGDLSYSHSFNCLKHDENRYQIDIVQNAMKAFTLAVVPRILGIDWVPQLPLPRTSLQKRKTYFRTLNHWTHQRLAEPDTDTRNDLMKYASLRKNKGLSLSETENSIGDMMIAGSETVASTLAAITYHLVRTPGACRVLTQEIRGCFKTEIEINMSGVSGLPYLNAVINEAMRLCPTLPMVLPRIVPESGARICGHWFPAGTGVSFCQLAAYTSPANFSSPEEFLPSRWLPKSELKVHKADAFHPFSIGQRNCIGKEFGLMEVRLIIAKLVWNFDISPGGEDWDWNSQKSYFVWSKQPLYVNLAPAKF